MRIYSYISHSITLLLSISLLLVCSAASGHAVAEEIFRFQQISLTIEDHNIVFNNIVTKGNHVRLTSVSIHPNLTYQLFDINNSIALLSTWKNGDLHFIHSLHYLVYREGFPIIAQRVSEVSGSEYLTTDTHNTILITRPFFPGLRTEQAIPLDGTNEVLAVSRSYCQRMTFFIEHDQPHAVDFHEMIRWPLDQWYKGRGTPKSQAVWRHDTESEQTFSNGKLPTYSLISTWLPYEQDSGKEPHFLHLATATSDARMYHNPTFLTITGIDGLAKECIPPSPACPPLDNSSLPRNGFPETSPRLLLPFSAEHIQGAVLLGEDMPNTAWMICTNPLRYESQTWGSRVAGIIVSRFCNGGSPTLFLEDGTVHILKPNHP